MSPRHADQLSNFFRELPPEPPSKCIRIQCIYCSETKAKNTTRQKEHLLKCKQYLAAHPEAAIAAIDADADGDDADGEGDGPTSLSMGGDQYNTATFGIGPPQNVGFAPNQRINGNPPGMGPAEGPPRKKQKSAVKQPKKSQAAPDPNDIPLATIHAAFEEFQPKPGDKCSTVRCRYCGTTRAKNTSRQRDHLRACRDFQAVNPMPAIAAPPLVQTAPMAQANGVNNMVDNNLRKLASPQMVFDFKLIAHISAGHPAVTGAGEEQWHDITKGNWTGGIGTGFVAQGWFSIVSPPNGMPRTITGSLVLRTNDQIPASIPCRISGILTGEHSRVHMSFEDVKHPNYAFLLNAVYVATGLHRGQEVVYEAYRVS